MRVPSLRSSGEFGTPKETSGETASPTRIQAINGAQVRKKAYARAIRQAEANGLTTYRGQRLTLRQLGATQRQSGETTKPFRRTSCGLDMLTWNCGGLSTTWTDNLSVLSEAKYCTIRLCMLVETQGKEESQFQSQDWRVLSLGSKKPNAGLLILVHSSLSRMDEIRFQHVTPGRLAHVRLPHERTHLDLIVEHQTVIRTTVCQQDNLAQRGLLLR